MVFLCLQQGEDSEDEAESLGADEEQAGPSYRQRVWVLCGGEGTQADLSLISGLHVYEELSKQPDLLVLTSPPYKPYLSASPVCRGCP